MATETKTDEKTEEAPATMKSRLGDFWTHWVKPFLVMGIILFAARSVLADWNDVPTGSMIPTILPGDRVFVNKLAYDLKVPFTYWRLARWGTPQRGEIVVFFPPKLDVRYVKRVVAIPGDTIELKDGVLFINGEKASYTQIDSSDPYVERMMEKIAGIEHMVQHAPGAPSMVRNFGPITVPEGLYFMMGDNRDNSFDSRYEKIDMVPLDRILGRSSAVALSVDPDRWYMPRFSRFFKGIQ